MSKGVVKGARKSVKYYWCCKCREIFNTTRVYKSRNSKKTCDACFKVRKYQDKNGGYSMTIKELDEYCKNKNKFVFCKNSNQYGFGANKE